MRQILTTAILLTWAILAFGQHTLKGKVFDEKGNSLAGATVLIPNGSLSTATDKNGVFRFDGLSKRHYALRISFIGYETASVEARVDQEVNIRLKVGAFSINEITVSSLRATDRSPIAFTNVDKEAISRNNLGQDIPYLLAQTPSLVVSSDAGTGVGYTGYRIRGTDASRINVTINGIPYNDADGQGVFWVNLPDFASSIENIQVQRGVGTSTNGAAAFGANLNIQTNNYAPKALGEISASYGSFNTQKRTLKASSGLLKNRWAFDGRLSTVTSDGYIDRAWVDMKSYYLQAGYYGERTRIKFITFGGTEQTYHAWNGVPKDSLTTNRTYNSCGFMGLDANGQPLYYKDQTDNYTQTHYQILGDYIINPSFSLNGGLHYTRGDGYYEEYKQDQSFKKYSIDSYSLSGATIKRSDLVRQKKMNNNFVGGVFSLNYNKENIRAQVGGAANCYWGEHWGDVTWIKDYPSTIFPKEYYRNAVEKWDANIYTKANYEFVRNVFVNAELQYRRVDYSVIGKNDKWNSNISQMQDINVKETFDFFNPKVGFLHKINDRNEYYASFAIANREPTRSNYTDASISNMPTNETLYDYEAGYKYQGDFVSLGANLFYMNYHNQLVLTGKINEIGEPLSENVLSSYRAGIEMVAGVVFSKNIRWDGSVTLSRNQISNFNEYVEVFDENWEPMSQQMNALQSTEIAYSPKITWNNSFTVNYGRFEAKITEQYVGKQFINNTGSDEYLLDAYFVSNLRFSYHLPVKKLRGIDFSILLNNLTNTQYSSNGWAYSYYQGAVGNQKRYDDFGYFPQAGINLLGGITIHL